jgi:hypothetical protein
MKVNIGNYVRWFGPFQLAYLLKYFGVSEDRCHEIGEKIPEKPFEWFHDNIQKRKVKVKIDSWDTWSLDHTLALIIYPALLKFRKDVHGCCRTDATDAPLEYLFDKSEKEPDKWGYAAGYNTERWYYILDEMIFAFKTIAEDDYDYDNFYINNKWDMEGLEAFEARRNNGLRLFGKYYNSLWT